MDFLTTNEIAKKWGITRRRVDVYLKNGRIEGTINTINDGMVASQKEKRRNLPFMWAQTCGKNRTPGQIHRLQ